MSVGTEWLIDATGCDANSLADLVTMRRVCEAILAGLELRVVGEPLWHVFGGAGGVTGLYLLTESHLACHTYPEHALATFNLYCCRPREDWPWAAMLAEYLGATAVHVRQFIRGSADSRTTQTTPPANARRDSLARTAP